MGYVVLKCVGHLISGFIYTRMCEKACFFFPLYPECIAMLIRVCKYRR